jgi:hypothetical protein
VEDFIDSAEKLFVLWRKFQCLIPDQAFVDVRCGSRADIAGTQLRSSPTAQQRVSGHIELRCH